MTRQPRKSPHKLVRAVKVAVFTTAFLAIGALSLFFGAVYLLPLSKDEIKLGLGLLLGLILMALFLLTVSFRFAGWFRGIVLGLAAVPVLVCVLLFAAIQIPVERLPDFASLAPAITEEMNLVPAAPNEKLILLSPFVNTSEDSLPGPTAPFNLAEQLQYQIGESTRDETIRVEVLNRPVQSPGEIAELLQQYQASLLIWGEYDQAKIAPQLAFGPRIPVEMMVDLDPAISVSTIHPAQITDRLTDLANLTLGIVHVNPYSVNDLQQALRYFKQASNGWEAHQWRGNSYYWMKGYDFALQDFDQAIALNPNEAHLYNNRGFIYGLRQQYEPALQDFDKALALDSTYKRAFINRAQIRAKLGDYEAAIADFSGAIDLDSSYALAYIGRGNLHSMQQDYPAAIADYDQAIAANPADALVYIHRGNANAALGNYQRAVQDYTHAYSLNPTDSLTLIHRGNSSAALGNLPAAIEDYTQVINLDPTVVIAYAHRASAYSTLGNYAAAIEDYSRALSLNQADPILFVNRGHAYGALQNYEAALADYTQALQLNPTDAAIFHSRANLYATLQDNWSAISDYSQAIALNPYDPTIFVSRGNAYSAVFEYEAALEDYSQAIELDSTYALAYTNRATIYETLWGYGWFTREQAIADYQAALSLISDPQWHENTRLALQALE